MLNQDIYEELKEGDKVWYFGAHAYLPTEVIVIKAPDLTSKKHRKLVDGNTISGDSCLVTVDPKHLPPFQAFRENMYPSRDEVLAQAKHRCKRMIIRALHLAKETRERLRYIRAMANQPK